MNELQELVLGAAQTPWALLALALLCFIDGFFPPLPSESIIITLAALGAAGEGPPVWLLVPVAAVGAFAGDQTAYMLGRHIPLDRVPYLRGPGGAKALTFASKALTRRGTVLIVSARFIPGGRVAVNLAAGATGFPHLRFMAVDGAAVLLWSLYSAGMGFGAGAILHEHPLAAVAVGVTGGVLLGLVLDWLISVFHSCVPTLPEPAVLDLEVDDTGRWDPEDLEEEHERSSAEVAWRTLREHQGEKREHQGKDVYQAPLGWWEYGGGQEETSSRKPPEEPDGPQVDGAN